jgi:hypothetical protein
MTHFDDDLYYDELRVCCEIGSARKEYVKQGGFVKTFGSVVSQPCL